jgi:hypothetical protein
MKPKISNQSAAFFEAHPFQFTIRIQIGKVDVSTNDDFDLDPSPLLLF